MSEPTRVRILVEIQQNAEGAILSSHWPLSEEDRNQMREWPSAGLVQIAHALFVESLKREAYTMVISQLSTGKSPGDLTSEEISELVRTHTMEMVDKFVRTASEGALRMVSEIGA